MADPVTPTPDDKPTTTASITVPATSPAPAHTPAATTPAAATPATPLWVDGTPYDPAKAKELADKLAAAEARNAEDAAKLVKLADLEKAQRDAEIAALSEQEKLALKAATAEKDLADARTAWTAREQVLLASIVELSVKLEAKDMGFIDPDDAAGLLDRTKLEIDPATGQPKNARKVLEALVEKKKHLVGEVAAVGGNAPSPRPQGRTGNGPVTAAVPFR